MQSERVQVDSKLVGSFADSRKAKHSIIACILSEWQRSLHHCSFLRNYLASNDTGLHRCSPTMNTCMVGRCLEQKRLYPMYLVVQAKYVNAHAVAFL